jgi:hypothetical protein
MDMQDRVQALVEESHMHLTSPSQAPAVEYLIKHRLTHVLFMASRSHQSLELHSVADEAAQALRHWPVEAWNVHSASPWQTLPEVSREQRTLQPPLNQLHSGSATHAEEVL